VACQVMSEGKSFHIHAPATGTAQRPTVESLTAGTDRLSVVEDRSGMSESGCRIVGSIPVTSWNISIMLLPGCAGVRQ